MDVKYRLIRYFRLYRWISSIFSCLHSYEYSCARLFVLSHAYTLRGKFNSSNEYTASFLLVYTIATRAKTILRHPSWILVEFRNSTFPYNTCLFSVIFPSLPLFSCSNEYIWLEFGRVLVRLYILLSSRVTSSPEYVSRFTNGRTTRKIVETVASTSVTRTTLLSHEGISFRKETSKERFTLLRINFSCRRERTFILCATFTVIQFDIGELMEKKIVPKNAAFATVDRAMIKLV